MPAETGACDAGRYAAGAALGAALALLTGCVGPPAACAVRPGVRVCAPTREDARDAAAAVERIILELRKKLPGLRETTVEIWLQERPQVVWFVPAASGVGALSNSWTGRIHATANSRHLDAELAHEVVHALLDASWGALPPTLEEGLCDQMASRVASGGAHLRADRLLLAIAAACGPPMRLRVHSQDAGWSEHVIDATFPRAGELDLCDAFTRSSRRVHPFLGSRSRAVWYGVGFVAAGRLLAALGPAGLRELCAATAREGDGDAAEALAAAAGLSAERGSWRAAILAELDDAAVVELARLIAPELARTARDVESQRRGDRPLDRAVLDARPQFRIVGHALSVDLSSLPEFRAALGAPGSLGDAPTPPVAGAPTPM
jgi:hypothetical protein